jgi:AcrR family transcriptional regulator
MARKRTYPIEVRRESILKAARKLLILKGYQELKLDDLARESKVAKGTLYLYFKNKENVFLEVMRDLIHQIEERMSAAAQKGIGLKIIRNLSREMVLFLYENRDFLAPLYIKQPTMCGAAAGGAVRKAFSKNMSWVSEQLKHCVKLKELRNHDTQQGANFLYALVRMFALFEIPENPKKPIETQMDELMDIFMNGLGRHAK